MKVWVSLLLSLVTLAGAEDEAIERSDASKKVFVLPVRDNIAPPMLYLVRRGVKQAMDEKAELLVIDMETNGGRVDTTEQVMNVLGRFKGQTVTYVNRKAFSAGAFIAVATQKIYMAPQSVIGAAAPVMLSPGGAGAEKMPDTMEVKTVSAVSALIRASAEKNGHNVKVIEAMVDKSRELIIDGEVLNEKGQLLTLTDVQAAKKYGSPPKPLLSSGTMETLDALLDHLGYAAAQRVDVKATGAERLGMWLNAISPLLLIIGIVGVYIEFKTPGFGLPGIIGVTAFVLYFLGGYVAGLSGLEWVAVFLLGLALVVVEMFVYPGTVAIGLAGAALMLVALVMAMVDIYPGMPQVPSLPQLRLPLQNLLLATAGGAVMVAILSRFLPKTPLYRALVSQSASGVQTEIAQEKLRAHLRGQIGTAISVLRPGGKAQFGDQIIDVMSQGDMIPKGTKVKIIGYSGTEAVVEAIQ